MSYLFTNLFTYLFIIYDTLSDGLLEQPKQMHNEPW